MRGKTQSNSILVKVRVCLNLVTLHYQYNNDLFISSLSLTNIIKKLARSFFFDRSYVINCFLNNCKILRGLKILLLFINDIY